MGIVTKVWNSSDTLTAADLNTNFSDLESYLAALTNTDISNDAGITSQKLADRYAVVPVPINVIPSFGESNAGAWATIAAPQEMATPNVTTDAGATEIFRFYPEIPSGRRAYLCSIALWANTTPDGANTPRVFVRHNTTVLSGGGADLVDATVNYLKNANPFSSPLVSVANGDYFAIRLAESGGAPTLAALSGTFTFKIEVTS